MSQLPNAIDRRNILYGDKTPKERLIQLGEAYLEADRWLDALEFFARAEHAPGLDRVREHAVASGDAFLAVRMEQLGCDPLAADQWAALGAKAEADGKHSFAATAQAHASPETATSA